MPGSDEAPAAAAMPATPGAAAHWLRQSRVLPAETALRAQVRPLLCGSAVSERFATRLASRCCPSGTLSRSLCESGAANPSPPLAQEIRGLFEQGEAAHPEVLALLTASASPALPISIRHRVPARQTAFAVLTQRGAAR